VQSRSPQGMTAIYGDVDRDAQEKESLKTIATALELGINLLDTAWIYQVCVSGNLYVINLLTKSAHAVFCAASVQCPSADGSKIYYNEEIVGKAIKIHGREKFVVCTKFGMSATREVSTLSSQIKHNQCLVINKLPRCFQISGKEDFLRKQLAESLSRLGTDYIDLYYMHRMDPSTPIEETMAVLQSLVQEGAVGCACGCLN
jgi:aryl-alcohol dehydrogenase-like predicted oxidoreductase